MDKILHCLLRPIFLALGVISELKFSQNFVNLPAPYPGNYSFKLLMSPPDLGHVVANIPECAVRVLSLFPDNATGFIFTSGPDGLKLCLPGEHFEGETNNHSGYFWDNTDELWLKTPIVYNGSIYH